VIVARPVFKAAEREPIEVQIGDEEADLSRLSLRTIGKVFKLIGDDPSELKGLDVETMAEAVAVLCEPSNSKITADFILDSVDGMEEALPFLTFALNLIAERGKGIGGIDLKNPTPSSTSPPE
jgi:hypothetical protein